MRDFPAIELTWRDGLFAHWSMDPSRVRPLIPDALDLDCRDGSAWVSALPSVVDASRPSLFPRSTGRTFRQVNLRTYVEHDGRPGVYFLSLDTSSGLGVRIARSLYGLPYYRADIDFEKRTKSRDRRTCRFVCERDHGESSPARFAATYRPTGRPTLAESGSLDDFLTERYRLYVVRGGMVWCARVQHSPWRLATAEASVQADSLLEAAGLPAPTADPLVRYSPESEFTIRTPFRV